MKYNHLMVDYQHKNHINALHLLKAFSSRPLPAVVRVHRDHRGNLMFFAMIERKINHGKFPAPAVESV